MKGNKLISFERKDIVGVELEKIVLEVADHFKIKKTFLPDFCQLFTISKRWNMSNLGESLNAWAKKFKRINGTKRTIDLVKKAFKLCTTNEEISHLRGLLVEAIVIGKYGGSACLEGTNYGWGANVILNIETRPPKTIRYICITEPKPYYDCGDRATVDFGYWNGHHGHFYECKVQPFYIRCKEINYMKELAGELKDLSISFETFFMCPTSYESVKAILLDNELDTVTFKPVGYDNLYS